MRCFYCGQVLLTKKKIFPTSAFKPNAQDFIRDKRVGYITHIKCAVSGRDTCMP